MDGRLGPIPSLLSGLRPALLTAVAVWLGYILYQPPEPVRLTLPERGIEVSVPGNLEGWRLEPGEGDVLVKGQTRGGLVQMEIVRVPVSRPNEVTRVILERQDQLRQGKERYTVLMPWVEPAFGDRPAPTYRAAFDQQLVGGLSVEIWLYETYWPYRGEYARISMRYPRFLAGYIRPDRALIAEGLRLDEQGGSP